MSVSEQTLVFTTRNGLPEATRSSMVKLLNQRLADLVVLKGLAKQMHWNVKGPHFQQLHVLFDEVTEVLDEPADMVAERAVMLGGLAEGTIRMAARNSDIVDIDITVTDGLEAVVALADRWGEVASRMQQAIGMAGDSGDEATADLFTEITRILDKHLWFIESHVAQKA